MYIYIYNIHQIYMYMPISVCIHIYMYIYEIYDKCVYTHIIYTFTHAHIYMSQVVRIGLQDASSVATMLTTTEAMIVQIQEVDIHWEAGRKKEERGTWESVHARERRNLFAENMYTWRSHPKRIGKCRKIRTCDDSILFAEIWTESEMVVCECVWECAQRQISSKMLYILSVTPSFYHKSPKFVMRWCHVLVRRCWHFQVLQRVNFITI